MTNYLFCLLQRMFVDVTIACGGKVYSAHKFVLSTCSEYFKQIFTHNHNNNPIVFMKDVSSDDIEALLDFMYHGEVSVPQASLASLIKTAEGLQIKGLAVQDDPPIKKRTQERDKRVRRDPSTASLENSSPPSKRRVRDRSSPSRQFNHQESSPSQHSSKSNSNSVDDTSHSNDSASVVRNNYSPNSDSKSMKKLTNNEATDTNKRHSTTEDDDRGIEDGADGNPMDDDSAGPSGLKQSKTEELVSH